MSRHAQSSQIAGKIDNDLLHEDRLTVKLNLNLVIRLTQPTMFLSVIFIIYFFLWRDCYESLTSTRVLGLFKVDKKEEDGQFSINLFPSIENSPLRLML